MSHDPLVKSWIPESSKDCLGCNIACKPDQEQGDAMKIWHTIDGASELVGIVVTVIQYHRPQLLYVWEN